MDPRILCSLTLLDQFTAHFFPHFQSLHPLHPPFWYSVCFSLFIHLSFWPRFTVRVHRPLSISWSLYLCARRMHNLNVLRSTFSERVGPGEKGWGLENRRGERSLLLLGLIAMPSPSWITEALFAYFPWTVWRVRVFKKFEGDSRIFQLKPWVGEGVLLEPTPLKQPRKEGEEVKEEEKG